MSTFLWETFVEKHRARHPVTTKNHFSSEKERDCHPYLWSVFEPQHDKTNKWPVRTAKTQISLGITPVWSEPSLSAWRSLGSLATHREHVPRLFSVLAECTSFCWICHAVAHLSRLVTKTKKNGMCAQRRPRVFAAYMKKTWVLSHPFSAQRRLWSNWADAQADLSLRWAHIPLCWFCREVAHLFVPFFA